MKQKNTERGKDLHGGYPFFWNSAITSLANGYLSLKFLRHEVSRAFSFCLSVLCSLSHLIYQWVHSLGVSMYGYSICFVIFDLGFFNFFR